MSSPAVDIKGVLDALGTLGDIRVGYIDGSPDVMGVIYEYGGLPTQGRLGVIGVGYEEPSIQVVFRGAPNDYAAPMIKARAAWAALAGVQPGALASGDVYLRIQPQQSPFSLGKDANNRFEIACNYYLEKEA